VVILVKAKKEKWQKFAQFLMSLSLLSVFAAAWGFLFSDIWLASTQWLLIAAVLAAFSLYIKMEN
jgi:threonine/homoserine efflux transporter RhtA